MPGCAVYVRAGGASPPSRFLPFLLLERKQQPILKRSFRVCHRRIATMPEPSDFANSDWPTRSAPPPRDGTQIDQPTHTDKEGSEEHVPSTRPGADPPTNIVHLPAGVGRFGR